MLASAFWHTGIRFVMQAVLVVLVYLKGLFLVLDLVNPAAIMA